MGGDKSTKPARHDRAPRQSEYDAMTSLAPASEDDLPDQRTFPLTGPGAIDRPDPLGRGRAPARYMRPCALDVSHLRVGVESPQGGRA